MDRITEYTVGFMTPQDFCKQLKGVFGFPVTPFHNDLSLDLDALARNLDEMMGYQFFAIVAAGGTGEMYSMTPQEIEDVVRVTVEATAGRMPVVAGSRGTMRGQLLDQLVPFIMALPGQQAAARAFDAKPHLLLADHTAHSRE